MVKIRVAFKALTSLIYNIFIGQKSEIILPVKIETFTEASQLSTRTSP